MDAPASPADGSCSEGVKVALAIALDELFVENVSMAVEAPEALLDGGQLGVTCQGYHRGALDAAAAAAMLRDLSPWISGDLVAETLTLGGASSALDLACDLVDAAGIAAGVELATAIVRLALSQHDRVPPRARPLLAMLAPYAARLAAKIEAGDTTEEMLAAALYG